MNSKVNIFHFKNYNTIKRSLGIIIFTLITLAALPQSSFAQDDPEKKIKQIKKEKIKQKKQKKKAVQKAKKDHRSIQGKTVNGKSRKKQMKKLERERKAARKRYR